jgi:tetratricopeptide (TPR) repeat protein
MNPQQIEDIGHRRQAEELLANPQGPDDIPRAYMMLGCLDEHEQDWVAAIAHYRQALAADPHHHVVRYFTNNNLGYSLIQLGRFDEAEKYCAEAIEVDPDRHNAHKNLGLVRQGQGDWLDAAFRFAIAYRIYPGDPRSLWHLEQLLSAQPQLMEQSDELREIVDLLREMIQRGGCARAH